MRILFVTGNRIGDAVLSTGLLGHLLERYPRARFTIACGPHAAPLFDAMPRCERVIVMTKQPRSWHWFDLWRRTALYPWHAAIDLRGSGLTFFLAARRRYVLRPAREPLHRVVHNANLLGLTPPPSPRLWPGQEHCARAASLLAPDEAVLALGATANWGGKQWPVERFVELVERLTGPGGLIPGARIAIIGGPDERDMSAPLFGALAPERTLDLVGTEHLLTVYAILRRARLFIGNDSAPMHMAAAAGIPTLGLFGPSREELYAPWGSHCAVVRTPRSFREIVGAPDYDHRQHVSRMLDLEVATVVEAAQALWQRAAGQGTPARRDVQSTGRD